MGKQKDKKRGKKKPPDKTPNHSSSGNTPSARAVATAPVASQKEMGKAEKEQLMRTLSSHLNTIHETFQVYFSFSHPHCIYVCICICVHIFMNFDF